MRRSVAVRDREARQPNGGALKDTFPSPRPATFSDAVQRIALTRYPTTGERLKQKEEWT